MDVWREIAEVAEQRCMNYAGLIGTLKAILEYEDIPAEERVNRAKAAIDAFQKN